MKVGIPRESLSGERRVAATPGTVERLRKLGFDVVVEAGAGTGASLIDSAYSEAGAAVGTAEEAWGADVVLKVNAPTLDEVDNLRAEQALLSFIWPAQNAELIKKLAGRGVTTLSMDCVPRITRAQKCDALSSLANIAGYRAVVEAASHFGSFFTGQVTAAGKVKPARVLVIGAGVAGLAAIGAARGLGAIVRAFDTREAVKEQVESMGGEFLVLEFEESGEGGGGYAKVMSKEFIDAEMALFREQAPEIDIVITTALIPGRPAPKLWMTDMVEAMKPGSVVVDMAAAQGGNCEVTVPGEVATHAGVTIIGYTDLTSRLATTASQLYGTNLCHLLDDLGGGEGWNVNMDDEVIRGALVTHEGQVTWPPPKPEPKAKPKSKPIEETSDETPREKQSDIMDMHRAAKAIKVGGEAEPEKRSRTFEIAAAVLILVWIGLKSTLTGGASAEAAQFLNHVTVFVLACFVGWQVVWNVTAALHTPLMSVTNAISGIIIVGGMLQAQGDVMDAATLLGGAAILLATINIAGGFLVTDRMLRMFRK